MIRQVNGGVSVAFQVESIPCLLYRINGVSSGSAIRYIQVFDSPTGATSVVNGAVPLESFPIAPTATTPTAEFQQHIIEGLPLKTGLYLIMSTTEATLTTSTDTMDWWVEIEEFVTLAVIPAVTTFAASLIDATGLKTILATGGTGVIKLSQIILSATSAKSIYLVLFTTPQTAGSQRGFVILPVNIRANIPQLVDFGIQNGLRCEGEDQMQTYGAAYSNGLYVLLSTTGYPYTTYTTGDITITAKYFPVANTVF